MFPQLLIGGIIVLVIFVMFFRAEKMFERHPDDNSLLYRIFSYDPSKYPSEIIREPRLRFDYSRK